jgi:uroporphyrin-III C-methyltransferase
VKGKVFLLGAGPGDPELITLKGVKCLEKADVVIYDRLINKQLLDYVNKDAQLIYCGKLPKRHTLKQATINHLLLKHGKEGKTVTRLKGGDPFVFGRGGEEAAVLAEHKIDFEIVPGITSGISAAAYAGIPLTHRNVSSSFTIVAGCKRNEDDLNWEGLVKSTDTLAIYMGVGNLEHICNQLLFHGKTCETPVALIQWGTTTEQKTVTGTLQNIIEKGKQQKIANPAMIIVGEVVRLREDLSWFESMHQKDNIETRIVSHA